MPGRLATRLGRRFLQVIIMTRLRATPHRLQTRKRRRTTRLAAHKTIDALITMIIVIIIIIIIIQASRLLNF